MPSVENPATDSQSFARCLRGTLADRLLLLLLLATIAGGWYGLARTLSHGEPMVMIYHGDTLLARYPLPHQAQVIHFPAMGDLGAADIEISQRGVRIVSAPCKTQYCVHTGHKHRPGELIACVPNRILVSIESADSAFDAVAE